MACQYRVTLSGIKGFYRVYRMSATSTLYAFHKQMRADMEFPADQVSMADTLKKGIVSFVYFYDVTNRKSVNVTFEQETQEAAGAPMLIDSKGPDPIDFENGYVAFEDLPADQRHLPGDNAEKKKRNPLEGLLSALDGLDDEDEEDDDDEEEDDEEDRDDDEAIEVYDGTEELTL